MEQVTKLTEKEIQQLNQVQNKQDELITRFGQLEYQIQNLELQKERLVSELEASKESEKQIANELNEKYGDGVINLKEGTFSNS